MQVISTSQARKARPTRDDRGKAKEQGFALTQFQISGMPTSAWLFCSSLFSYRDAPMSAPYKAWEIGFMRQCFHANTAMITNEQVPKTHTPPNVLFEGNAGRQAGRQADKQGSLFRICKHAQTRRSQNTSQTKENPDVTNGTGENCGWMLSFKFVQSEKKMILGCYARNPQFRRERRMATSPTRRR